MTGRRFHDEALSPVVGTILLIAIAVAIAGVAWFMFNRVAEDELKGDSVHVGFTTNTPDRSVQVVDFSQELTWSTDLLVSGDCAPNLNGGAISGRVEVGDILRCASPGELRITTSEEIGGDLIYRKVFE